VYYSIGNKESVSLDGIDLKGATITHNSPEYSYKISLLKEITNVVYNDIYLDGFKYLWRRIMKRRVRL